MHPLETEAGNGAVTIRQVALKLAEISGIEHAGATGARRGARKPKDGPATPEAEKGPSTTAPASPGAPNGRERSSGKAAEPKAVNKPLDFALSLDPAHPYLAERGGGLSPELVLSFGLGFCAKGIMAGREVCIRSTARTGRS